MLHCAETWFPGAPFPAHRLAELPALAVDDYGRPRFWPHRDIDPFVPESQAIGVRIQVIVNDGRWLVYCPTCRGAQFASKGDRRFFCEHCLNEAHGRQWIAVEWPEHHEDIETVLDGRPPVDPDSRKPTRYWEPHETVADLIEQNDEHGAPVPDHIRFRHMGGSAPTTQSA